MDVFDIIREDHQAVQKILNDMQETSSRATQRRQEDVTKFTQLIEPHMMAEEEVFYPQARERGESKLREHVIEAYDEHRIAKMVLAELQKMSPQDEAWLPKAKVLKDLIEHHIEEEEGELFEEARKALNQQQIQQITQQFHQTKDKQMQKAAGRS
jgi:hemerythrin-like domain-containing protein